MRERSEDFKSMNYIKISKIQRSYLRYMLSCTVDDYSMTKRGEVGGAVDYFQIHALKLPLQDCIANNCICVCVCVCVRYANQHQLGKQESRKTR